MIETAIIFAFILPGLSVACMSGVSNQRLLLATPLSLSLLVLVSGASQLTSSSQYTAVYFCSVAVLLLLTVASRRVFRSRLVQSCKEAVRFLPILTVVLIYTIYSGAFTDFGIDVYQHMVFVQEGIRYQEENHGALKFAFSLGTTNFLFHNIGVVVHSLANISIRELIEVYSITFSILWTFGIYLFSRYLLQLLLPDSRLLEVLVFIAVIFYWLTFGINNFSFPRYYIGGPVILNYGVYLAMVVVYLEMLLSRLSVSKVVLLSILSVTAVIVHPQEIFLFVTFGLALSSILLLSRIVNKNLLVDIDVDTKNTIASALFVATAIFAVYCSIRWLPRYAYDPISLLNLGWLSSALGGLNILRPNHQFYTVLSFWGLYVYFLSIVFWRQSVIRVIVLAILVMPFLTVFNPFFAEAYMRHAYPQVLWRLLFAIPLPVLAAFFIGVMIRNWKYNSHYRKATTLVLFSPLVAFLLPIQGAILNNDMVKTPSLIPTPANNSYRYWNDMVDFLEFLPERENILTDPVTGYVIRSLTKHFHAGYKFYPKNYIDYAGFDSYENHPLAAYSGWLLIANRRDGDVNERLRPPFHIYPDVMQTSKFYPAKLMKNLRERTDRYQLIWEKNSIAIYRIK